MKAHVLRVLILDFDNVGSSGTASMIENAHYPNRAIAPQVTDLKTYEIGEWTNDHPLNRTESFRAALDSILNSTPEQGELRANDRRQSRKT